MRLKTLLLPALLLVLLAAASPALAQNRSESWEFGPYFVGFDFDSEIEIEDEWGGGLRFGYNFVPMHEIELAFEGVGTEDDPSEARGCQPLPTIRTPAGPIVIFDTKVPAGSFRVLSRRLAMRYAP